MARTPTTSTTRLGVEIDGNCANAVTISDGVVVSRKKHEAESGAAALAAAINSATVRDGIIVVTSGIHTRSAYLNVSRTIDDPAQLHTQLRHALSTPDDWRYACVIDPGRSNDYGLAVASNPIPVTSAYDTLDNTHSRGIVVPVAAVLAGDDEIVIRIGRRSIDITASTPTGAAAYTTLGILGVDSLAAKLSGQGAREQITKALTTGSNDPVISAEVDKWLTDMAQQARDLCENWSISGIRLPQRLRIIGQEADSPIVRAALSQALEVPCHATSEPASYLAEHAARQNPDSLRAASYPDSTPATHSRAVSTPARTRSSGDEHAGIAAVTARITSQQSLRDDLHNAQPHVSARMRTHIDQTLADLDTGLSLHQASRHLPAALRAWLILLANSPDPTSIAELATWAHTSARADNKKRNLRYVLALAAPLLAAALVFPYTVAGAAAVALAGTLGALAWVMTDRRKARRAVAQAIAFAQLAAHPVDLRASEHLHIVASASANTEWMRSAQDLAAGRGARQLPDLPLGDHAELLARASELLSQPRAVKPAPDIERTPQPL